MKNTKRETTQEAAARMAAGYRAAAEKKCGGLKGSVAVLVARLEAIAQGGK